MKAETQYCDYIGTASVDLAEDDAFEKLVKSLGVDTARYEFAGICFTSGHQLPFNVSIILNDRSQNEPHLISVKAPISRETFLQNLRRIHVVLHKEFSSFHDVDCSEEMTLEEFLAVAKPGN